jgi:hypothetical protein
VAHAVHPVAKPLFRTLLSRCSTAVIFSAKSRSGGNQAVVLIVRIARREERLPAGKKTHAPEQQ